MRDVASFKACCSFVAFYFILQRLKEIVIFCHHQNDCFNKYKINPQPSQFRVGDIVYDPALTPCPFTSMIWVLQRGVGAQHCSCDWGRGRIGESRGPATPTWSRAGEKWGTPGGGMVTQRVGGAWVFSLAISFSHYLVLSLPLLLTCISLTFAFKVNGAS